MTSVRSTAGLEGVVAGQTALSTVGKEGCGLTYRGYAIEDLAEHACFEEVAWLLLRGELPTRPQLEGYRQRLSSLRGLPAPLRTVLEQLPPTAHPMDVLRTGCSAAIAPTPFAAEPAIRAATPDAGGIRQALGKSAVRRAATATRLPQSKCARQGLRSHSRDKSDRKSVV